MTTYDFDAVTYNAIHRNENASGTATNKLTRPPSDSYQSGYSFGDMLLNRRSAARLTGPSAIAPAVPWEFGASRSALAVLRSNMEASARILHSFGRSKLPFHSFRNDSSEGRWRKSLLQLLEKWCRR